MHPESRILITETNIMKASTESIIATATAAISAAALESITAIVTAKAKLTITIREQVALLEKAGVPQKEIASLVRDAVNGAASPAHISKVLVSCGVRLRGKRSDAGFLRMADGALEASMEAKPATATSEDDSDDSEDNGEDNDNDIKMTTATATATAKRAAGTPLRRSLLCSLRLIRRLSQLRLKSQVSHESH